MRRKRKKEEEEEEGRGEGEERFFRVVDRLRGVSEVAGEHWRPSGYNRNKTQDQLPNSDEKKPSIS